MTRSKGTASRRTGRRKPPRGSASIDPDEVARFDALAKQWWDPEGSFKPLHKLNPTRLAFIRDRLADHFGRDPRAGKPLEGLRLLDIGCGGGLLSEPLARLGAAVTGIDAAAEGLEVATRHARESGLDIDYRPSDVEALAESGSAFDVVVNMEVVEHVADREAFLAASARLVAPGGAMVLATLNRTPKAFALAIVGAEYLLRWLPRGTHDWHRFVRPSELVKALRRHGLVTEEVAGLVYSPFTDRWRVSAGDTDVNYLVFAVKA